MTDSQDDIRPTKSSHHWGTHWKYIMNVKKNESYFCLCAMNLALVVVKVKCCYQTFVFSGESFCRSCHLEWGQILCFVFAHCATATTKDKIRSKNVSVKEKRIVNLIPRYLFYQADHSQMLKVQIRLLLTSLISVLRQKRITPHPPSTKNPLKTPAMVEEDCEQFPV